MINPAEFLKWCQVFQVNRGGGGGLVTLQGAYDGGSTINLASGNPIDISDPALLMALNISSDSRKIYTDYYVEAPLGIISHSLNAVITSNLTITQAQLDVVNVNLTNNAYTYTFPTSDVFADGSDCGFIQEGVTGSITIVFPTGVYLNGVQNTSVVLNAPYQNALFRKIGAQKYISILDVPGITYLKIAANLSDLNNIRTAVTNIGLQNGYIYVISSQTLIAPLPININIGVTAPDQAIQLPDATTINSNFVGRDIFINNYSSFSVTFLDHTGAPINGGSNIVNASTNYFLRLDDISTPQGIWYLYPFVSRVNGQTGNTIIDLNSAYAQTGSQNFDITSGLNINGSGLNFFGTDLSVTQFNGAYTAVNNPTDQGVNGVWSDHEIRGQTTGTPGQLISIDSYGFNYELITGQESSYYIKEILNLGDVNGVFYIKGADATQGCRVGFGGSDPVNSHIENFSVGLSFNDVCDPSAIVQYESTTQGFLMPRMSTTEIGLIPSPALGLELFDKIEKVKKYYDGLDFETVYSSGNIIDGTNFSTVDNLDGTFTFNVIGGGSGGTSGQSSFNMINNTTPSSPGMGGVAVPIGIISGALTVITSVNFSTTISSNTLDIQNLSSASVNAQFSFTINVVGTVPINNIYTFWILIKNGATLTQTDFRAPIVLSDAVTPKSLCISGIIPVPPSASIQVGVTSSSGGNLITVRDVVGEVLDTVQLGGLTNTDFLPEGPNNKFLTIDGGATYKNISGSLIVGNLVQANTPGGQLIDSGISASNLVAGIFNPVLTAVSGVSGTPTLISATYSRNRNIVTGFVQFTADVTSSTPQIGINLPVASVFTTANQAQGTGDMFITSSPGPLDGKVQNIISDVANARMTANIISANAATNITASITYSYEILP